MGRRDSGVYTSELRKKNTALNYSSSLTNLPLLAEGKVHDIVRYARRLARRTTRERWKIGEARGG